MSSSDCPYFYQGRDSDGRLPFLSQLDLYLQHQVRFGNRLRLTLSANAINLLNQATVTNYFPDELFPGLRVPSELEAVRCRDCGWAKPPEW